MYYVTALRRDAAGEITHLKVHENGPKGLRAGTAWSRKLVEDYLAQGLKFVICDRATEKIGHPLLQGLRSEAQLGDWDALENLPPC